MTATTGHLLIADTSGYTEYLTSSELEHANPMLRSLLTAMVEQVGEHVEDGRRRRARLLDRALPDRRDVPGHLREPLQRVRDAAARHRRQHDLSVPGLCQRREPWAEDHGSPRYVRGAADRPDDRLVGCRCHLGASHGQDRRKDGHRHRELCAVHGRGRQAMGIEAALVPYSQPFEHFGDVQMQVYDLGAGWERFRDRHARHYIGPDEGAFTYRRHFPHSPGVLWDGLVDPELKRAWMDMISVTADAPEGRLGTGSRYHCVHAETELYYWITDWRPFNYFSVRFADPFHPGLTYHETYELEPVDDGTVLRYAMGTAVDADSVPQDAATAENIAFIKDFWDHTLPFSRSCSRGRNQRRPDNRKGLRDTLRPGI